MKNTTIITVAAHDATDEAKASADFICDGVDDQAEIHAALKLIEKTGGKVEFSSGTFLGAKKYQDLNNIKIKENP